MACLEMYSKEPNPNNGGVATHFAAPMSPRISFSNDFVESAAQKAVKPVLELTQIKDASSSSDFEFSVTGYSMITAADELFFKGQILPFKDLCRRRHGKRGAATTLREELLIGKEEEEDDHDDSMELRPPKGSTASRWKGLMGLRKAHIGSKNAGVSESAHHSAATQVDKRGPYPGSYTTS